MPRKVCIVTGVGPGTGRAVAIRFAEEYEVAMIARDKGRLDEIAAGTPGTHVFPCDVLDTEALDNTLNAIRDQLGSASVVVHNAVGGAFGDFTSIEPKVLRRNFEINTMALLQIAQHCYPAMEAAGEGAIICTGNTSAYRGKAFFSGFAPTKAAQRILAESMARHAGPKGIHVAYVAIDAVINLPWTRERYADKPDDFFCEPADIAHHVWQVAHQPRSAWTFDSVIRPFGENW